MHLLKLAASLVSFGIVVAALAACSSGADGGPGSGVGALGDAGGGSAASCPKAGAKACPNGKMQDALDEMLCNVCLAEVQANDACNGPHGCTADGNDATNVKPECSNEFRAVLDCYSNAQVHDAGPHVGD